MEFSVEKTMEMAVVVPPIAKELAGGMSEGEAMKVVRRLKVTKTPILQQDVKVNQRIDVDVKRKELLAYFKNTWDITEMLFQVLKPNAFYLR